MTSRDVPEARCSNPRLVSEKLMSYLPPAERSSEEEGASVAQLDVEARAA